MPDLLTYHLVSTGGDHSDTRISRGINLTLLLKVVVGRLSTRVHNDGGRLAENHATDGVLWSGEASHEGDHSKDADASTEQVESPAKGCQLVVQDGCCEHVHVLVKDDGSRSSTRSCKEKTERKMGMVSLT